MCTCFTSVLVLCNLKIPICTKPIPFILIYFYQLFLCRFIQCASLHCVELKTQEIHFNIEIKFANISNSEIKLISVLIPIRSPLICLQLVDTMNYK